VLANNLMIVAALSFIFECSQASSDPPPSQFNLPPSARVFMFCSACMKPVRRLSPAAARAASSGGQVVEERSVDDLRHTAPPTVRLM
jgi:hypothetical protein